MKKTFRVSLLLDYISPHKSVPEFEILFMAETETHPVLADFADAARVKIPPWCAVRRAVLITHLVCTDADGNRTESQFPLDTMRL